MLFFFGKTHERQRLSLTGSALGGRDPQSSLVCEYQLRRAHATSLDGTKLYSATNADLIGPIKFVSTMIKSPLYSCRDHWPQTNPISWMSILVTVLDRPYAVLGIALLNANKLGACEMKNFAIALVRPN